MSGTLNAILSVNAGSSSLKFALYPQNGLEIGAAGLSGIVEGLEAGGTPVVKVSGKDGSSREALEAGKGTPHERALVALDAALKRHAQGIRITAVVHRIVHGGRRFSESVQLDDSTLDYLDSLIPLAPLHQPHNLAGVHACRKSFPDLPQIGCFDTAFHATVPEQEYTFALPKTLRDAGIRRYGFHGLSYRYVSASGRRPRRGRAPRQRCERLRGKRWQEHRHHHGLFGAGRSDHGHAQRRYRSRRAAAPAAS